MHGQSTVNKSLYKQINILSGLIFAQINFREFHGFDIFCNI